MTKQSALLVVDIDSCPITDNPIIKFECGSCKYYVGFEICTERPCIKCSWRYIPD